MLRDPTRANYFIMSIFLIFLAVPISIRVWARLEPVLARALSNMRLLLSVKSIVLWSFELVLSSLGLYRLYKKNQKINSKYRYHVVPSVNDNEIERERYREPAGRPTHSYRPATRTQRL